jgi:hypothetical protein
MLKEELLKLKELPTRNSECKIGDFIKEMDEETKSIFVDIMYSNTTHVKIAQILTSEGMFVSDNTVRRVRNRCFSSETACSCISGENNGI